MTEKEVTELRKMFNFEGLTEQVETACTEAIQEKSMTQQEVFEKIAQESKKRFMVGIQKFDELYDKYPMKVPVYVHPAFYEESQR